MADISKLKLPNGTEYNLKDTVARNSGARASNLYATAAGGTGEYAGTIPFQEDQYGSSGELLTADCYDVNGGGIPTETTVTTLSVNSTNFALYNSSPYTTTDTTIRLRRYGNFVTLTGMVKPKASITGSDTEYTICTVPAVSRPPQTIVQMMHGSTQYHWCLKVNTNGTVTFSRYSATTSYAAAGTSTWLPFHVSWIV